MIPRGPYRGHRTSWFRTIERGFSEFCPVQRGHRSVHQKCQHPTTSTLLKERSSGFHCQLLVLNRCVILMNWFAYFTSWSRLGAQKPFIVGENFKVSRSGFALAGFQTYQLNRREPKHKNSNRNFPLDKTSLKFGGNHTKK